MLKVIAIIIILGALLTYPAYLELRKYRRHLAKLDEENKNLEENERRIWR